MTSQLSSTLLVAMPQLQDPNFKRSVIVLVHHNEEGAFGLVVNRTVDLSAGSLCASLDMRWGGDPLATIHWGGPVQPNTGWVLFGDGIEEFDTREEVSEVAEGLYFAGSLDVLRGIAESPPANVRLLLGYAGWGPGQLENEIAEGSWLVAPISTDAIFVVPCDAMWDHVVRSMGVDPVTLISTRGIH